MSDIFRPTTQHYKLTFILYRYPDCYTDQTPTTQVEMLGSSEDPTGWCPYVWVDDRSSCGRRSYTIDLTFKIGGRQVDRSQTVPQGEQTFIDYAVWATWSLHDWDRDEYTNPRLYYSCEWGSGGTTEATIAHNVMMNINDVIVRGYEACPWPWSTDWSDAAWDNAIPGSASLGLCCCRAHGMMLAGQILGLGRYTHVYVNERPEPGEKDFNPSDPVWCAACNRYCYRGVWDAGFWNPYEAACRSGGEGTTCYAPAGRYEGTYNENRDAFGQPKWYWYYEDWTSSADKCPGGEDHLQDP